MASFLLENDEVLSEDGRMCLNNGWLEIKLLLRGQPIIQLST